MNQQNFNALDFSYLLLEFYKEMNIDERELSVILMIDHLLESKNDFITTELLSLKMKMPAKEIDLCLTNLYKKKYIEFDTTDSHPKTSLEPIKKIIYKKFEKSIFSEQEIKSNNELEEKRQYIFDEFSKVFARDLSPIELSHIDEWIKNGIDTDVIMNSLKDANNKKHLSINFIDTLIIKKTNNG